jgi:hypothetical protein
MPSHTLARQSHQCKCSVLAFSVGYRAVNFCCVARSVVVCARGKARACVTLAVSACPGPASAWAAVQCSCNMSLDPLQVFVSLEIPAQADLLKICVQSGLQAQAGREDSTDVSPQATDEETLTPTESSGGASSVTTEVTSVAAKNLRRLLASAGVNPCPQGKESLWASELIHKAHILIFLIAASHIA